MSLAKSPLIGICWADQPDVTCFLCVIFDLQLTVHRLGDSRVLGLLRLSQLRMVQAFRGWSFMVVVIDDADRPTSRSLAGWSSDAASRSGINNQFA